MDLFQHLKDSHPFSNVGSRDRRCSGGDPHDTMRPIVAVSKQAKGKTREEIFYPPSHFMKHNCHAHKSLHGSDARFVELLSKVLAFGGPGESRILSELRLLYSLHDVLTKVRFFARTDLDNSVFIPNARFTHICNVHLG